jgi:hypothetical protein
VWNSSKYTAPSSTNFFRKYNVKEPTISSKKIPDSYIQVSAVAKAELLQAGCCVARLGRVLLLMQAAAGGKTLG